MCVCVRACVRACVRVCVCVGETVGCFDETSTAVKFGCLNIFQCDLARGGVDPRQVDDCILYNFLVFKYLTGPLGFLRQ